MTPPQSTSSATLAAFASCAAVLGSFTQLAFATAEANALRDSNVPKPGAAIQDPQAFGPVNDLSGAVFADQMPHVDATGQVNLEVSAKWGVVRAPPGAAHGGASDLGQGGKTSEGTVNKSVSQTPKYSVFHLTLVVLFLLGGYLVRRRVLRRRQNPVMRAPKASAQSRLDSGFIHTESGL